MGQVATQPLSSAPRSGSFPSFSAYQTFQQDHVAQSFLQFCVQEKDLGKIVGLNLISAIIPSTLFYNKISIFIADDVTKPVLDNLKFVRYVLLLFLREGKQNHCAKIRQQVLCSAGCKRTSSVLSLSGKISIFDQKWYRPTLLLRGSLRHKLKTPSIRKFMTRALKRSEGFL